MVNLGTGSSVLCKSKVSRATSLKTQLNPRGFWVCAEKRSRTIEVELWNKYDFTSSTMRLVYLHVRVAIILIQVFDLLGSQ